MSIASESRFPAKRLQLLAAVPASVLWILIGLLSTVWWIGYFIALLIGNLGGFHWTTPYLMTICTIAIVLTIIELRLLVRAVKGQSKIWPHIALFLLAICFVGLIGIVGD